VAVRSSATAEDLPEASFAGQQETYLNIRGERMLLDAVRRCFASLFTDRAIVVPNPARLRPRAGRALGRRAEDGPVRPGVRGVMFSLDTESGFRDVVLINGAYGLGESVVQGTVNPDEFYVFKPTLREGFRPILQKKLGTKEFKLVYEEGGIRPVRSEPVPAGGARALRPDRRRDPHAGAMGGRRRGSHYSKVRGEPSPMDMEWAKDGITGELFLLQARPETVHVRQATTALERHLLDESGEVLVTGRAVGERIGKGRARVIRSVTDLRELQPGEVLVTEMTDPDWEPVMKRAPRSSRTVAGGPATRRS
jgi:pyruvate, water dikinase